MYSFEYTVYQGIPRLKALSYIMTRLPETEVTGNADKTDRLIDQKGQLSSQASKRTMNWKGQWYVHIKTGSKAQPRPRKVDEARDGPIISEGANDNNNLLQVALQLEKDIYFECLSRKLDQQ